MQISNLLSVVHFSAVQWKKNWLSLLTLTIGFAVLLLVQALNQGVQHRYEAALEGLQPNQIWVSAYGKPITEIERRAISQQLSKFGEVFPLHTSFSLLDNVRAIYWVYGSARPLQAITSDVIPPQLDRNIALSNMSENSTSELSNENRSYQVIPSVTHLNPAFLAFIHAKEIIWVPTDQHPSEHRLSAQHFMILNAPLRTDNQNNIDQIKRALASLNLDSKVWHVNTPNELLKMQQLNIKGMLIFFMTLSFVAIFAGVINFIHLLLLNVRQRHTEIALRIMLGARSFDLMVQFFIEAIVVTYVCLFLSCIVFPIIAVIMNYYGTIQISYWILPSLSTLFICYVVALICSIYPGYLAGLTSPKDLLIS